VSTLERMVACHCSMTAGAKRGVIPGDESLARTKASSVKAPTPAQLGFESELFWSNLKIQKDREREREILLYMTLS
jgi:homoaconitase/3-isopropylmalate dehydratase large subunit